MVRYRGNVQSPGVWAGEMTCISRGHRLITRATVAVTVPPQELTSCAHMCVCMNMCACVRECVACIPCTVRCGV